MTTTQQLLAARLHFVRAQRKLRQRQAVTAAAVKRSELARWYRAKGMTWKEVAQQMGLNSQFTARTAAMRNPKR